jgi:hypothetical protein
MGYASEMMKHSTRKRAVERPQLASQQEAREPLKEQEHSAVTGRAQPARGTGQQKRRANAAFSVSR